MKTYYIYNVQTDKFIGTVEASNVDAAELKAYQTKEFESGYTQSESLAAFSEKMD